MEVKKIIIKNLWIIEDSGLCLVNYGLKENSQVNYDESIIGGFTSALVKLIVSTGLDKYGFYSISLRERNLYYYYKDQLIICIEAEKKINKKMIAFATKKIHNDFLTSFSESLKSNKLINLNKFNLFKEKVVHILTKTNLMDSNYSFKSNLINMLVKTRELEV